MEHTSSVSNKSRRPKGRIPGIFSTSNVTLGGDSNTFPKQVRTEAANNSETQIQKVALYTQTSKAGTATNASGTILEPNTPSNATTAITTLE